MDFLFLIYIYAEFRILIMKNRYFLFWNLYIYIYIFKYLEIF